MKELHGKKIIHYCWFGGKPLNKLAKKCLKSWKKYLPDYEIVCWNEENFDVHINKFCEEAYEQGKWAFVADVARCYALKEYGGLYFDTDMCVTTDIRHILEGSFAAGWESEYNVAAGIIWAREPEHPVICRLWEYYENNAFDFDNVYTFSIPTLLTDVLQTQYGLKYFCDDVQYLEGDVRIYPKDYFYPIPSDGTKPIYTDNTCMVHYYVGSWLPRSERLRAKFKAIFGETLGYFLLDILVFGKHVLKKLLKIVSHPITAYRKKQFVKKSDARWIEEFDENTSKLKSTEYITFYNKAWFGPSVSTKVLFENTVPLTELWSDFHEEYVAKYVASSGAKVVIFSGFAVGWKDVAEKIKKLMGDDIQIKVLWHGGLALNVEGYDWDMFSTVFSLLNHGVIDSIGFVKKSLYEFYKEKGFHVEFVAGRCSVPEEIKAEAKPVPHEGVRIGLYASGDRWCKNFYNQIAAASLFENAVINCLPLNWKSVVFCKMLGVRLTGSYVNVKHDKMLTLLSGNDINFYTTFTECSPLLPLESMEMGVPCITGNNHHYWKDTPLEKYLIVDQVDDVMEIYRKAKLCLDNRDEVMRLYEAWKQDYYEESVRTVKQFTTA